MNSVATTSAGLALVLLQACYLHHARDEGRDGAAAVRDAGRLEGGDAGRRERDAGSEDAGALLPPEPDPDLGPDARPSDYPEADDWVDPPDIGDDEECCVLSEPVRLTSRDEGMALLHDPPLITYGPGVWGLAVTRTFLRSDDEQTPQPVIWRLAAEGAPLGEPRRVEPTPGSSLDTLPVARSLRWAEGRWALVADGAAPPGGGTRRRMYARLLDRDLRYATGWLPLGVASGVDVARLTSGVRWIGLGVTDEVLRVTPFSDLGAEPTLERSVPGWRRLRAAGLRSRAAALVSHPDTRGAPPEIRVIGAGPGYGSLGGVPLAARNTYQTALTALRDNVVAVTEDLGPVRVEVVDPFSVAHVAGPVTVGDTGAVEPSSFPRVGIAGDDKHGVAGVCIAVPGGEAGTRGESRIELRLVGPDGAPLGRGVTVIRGAFRGREVNCSIGSDERGFLVGWWDGSELWVRRVDIAE